MANLTNSHSLSDFQENGPTFIEAIKENKRPLLLTVNGQVEAVVIDVTTYQELEDKAEFEALRLALEEGEKAIVEGREMPLEAAHELWKARYGL